MTYLPTPTEHAAFSQMQARLVALLLRHDERRFGRYVDANIEYVADEALRPYRDLAVLFVLRDELFDDILPRIVRRLSFESPRHIMIEEPPPRGRVDWERTLDATWAERPGETPLLVHTRQRRRDFATPENLLAVVTLLEYRADTLHLLWGDREIVGSEPLRHPLNEIAERCERELAFPQFAGLRRAAEQEIEAGNVESLEARVAERLIRGANSAYDDLLRWRERLRELRLLQRTAGASDQVLGADPNRDNYLFQLWIFYELVELLQRRRQLISIEPAKKLVFSWGQPHEQVRYVLTHDQAIPKLWPDAPGVRPDLYIRRAEARELLDDDAMIWREQGYVLDAKYYKPRDTPKAPASPVKRMIADLHLTGERHGALLFAFQRDGDTIDVAADDDRVVELDLTAPKPRPLYRIAPDTSTAFALRPDVRIGVWRVQPELSPHEGLLEGIFSALLDRVHAVLRSPIPIACHGMLPDVDTVSPNGARPEHCPKCGQGVLAFCPKPHVAPDRIDRVCPRCDCLQSRRLCHIIDDVVLHPVVPPFVKRILSMDELVGGVKTLRSWLRDNVGPDDTSERADRARDYTIRTIGELTDTYMQLTRPDTVHTENVLREWVFAEYWSDETHRRGLAGEARHMLISGEFVWNHLVHSTIEDWAACAVQYTRALEYELYRRFYEPCGRRLFRQEGDPMQPKQFTIGTPMFIYRERKKDANWSIVLERVALPSGADEATLRQLVIDVEQLRGDRNRVAHTEAVDKTIAGRVRDTVLGRPGQPGLLLRLCSTLDPPLSLNK